MVREPVFQSGDFSEDEEPSFDVPANSGYSAEELRHDEELRPQRLDDVVGQTQSRRTPADHSRRHPQEG